MDVPRLRQVAGRLTLNPFQSRTPLPGSHPSRQPGSGFGFLGYREYQFGDDIRHVDWNVTARHTRPMLKTFERERASAFMLVLDTSASMWTPTPDKWHHAIDLATIIALVGARESELVGAVVVSNVVESQLPLGRGLPHAMALGQWLTRHRPQHRQTALGGGIDRAARALTTPGVIVVLSDFLGSPCETAIKRAAERHTVVALMMRSPHDIRLPGPGMIEVRDAETGRRAWIDSSSEMNRRSFAAAVNSGYKNRRRRLAAAGAVHLEARTDTSHAYQLRGLCCGRSGQPAG